MSIKDRIVESYLKKVRSSDSIKAALKTIEPETYMQSYRLLLKKWANTDSLVFFYDDRTLHSKDEMTFVSIVENELPF